MNDLPVISNKRKNLKTALRNMVFFTFILMASLACMYGAQACEDADPKCPEVIKIIPEYCDMPAEKKICAKSCGCPDGDSLSGDAGCQDLDQKCPEVIAIIPEYCDLYPEYKEICAKSCGCKWCKIKAYNKYKNILNLKWKLITLFFDYHCHHWFVMPVLECQELFVRHYLSCQQLIEVIQN